MYIRAGKLRSLPHDFLHGVQEVALRRNLPPRTNSKHASLDQSPSRNDLNF